MKKLFIYVVFQILLLLFSKISFACQCQCNGDCSFKVISKNKPFVALIKVIEYTDFLVHPIDGYNKKMPFSMTVEVVKVYKGIESRKNIRIWGDNGVLCRPYIGRFKIGEYYLIAPTLLDCETPIGCDGVNNDYTFFSCFTDYLIVNFTEKKAYGAYSTKEKTISLRKVQRNYD